MATADFFIKLAVILLSARVMAEVFAKVGLPGVIGEVAAGIIIGPSLFGIIGQEPVLVLLANIGILLLLFEVGAETEVGRLMAVGGQSALVAVTGVVLPFLAGWLICRYGFGLPNTVSLFAGGTLVATSIGLTLRVLKELGHHRGHVAQVVLGAAVLDDIIGVIMLAVLIQYTQVSGVDILPSLKMLGFISIFLSAAYFVGPYIERALLLLGKGSRTPGVVITLVICLMLALSALAHSFGAPEIIGAFAAGIALSGKPSSSSGLARRADIKAGELVGPVAEVFVPVFFVMVGVSIDFGRIDASSGHFGGGHFWAFAGILTVAAFLTKMLAGVWVKGPLRKKLAAGVAMAPRGEVGLIFAQTGLLYGIFDQSTYASMVFVVALTTLAAPVLLKIVAGSADSGGGRPVI